MQSEIKKNLKNLGFRDSEIQVYLALTKLGEAPASQIAKKADMPRTTVISIIDKLHENQFLTTHKYRGLTYYWVESPKALVNLFEHKINIANDLNNLLTLEYRKDAHFPFAETYDTKTSIRQFIEKLLTNLEKNSIIYTIDLPKAGNYSKIFTDKIGSLLNQQKKKRKIRTHTLIPAGTFDADVEKKSTMVDMEIREMPAGINFSASLWIVNNSIVHFSGNPPFVSAITHQHIIPSIKSIYDFLWNISKNVSLK